MSNAEAKPVIGEIFLQRAYHVPEGPVNQRIAWAQADVRGNAWCVIVGFTQGEHGDEEVLFMTRISNPTVPLRMPVGDLFNNWERP